MAGTTTIPIPTRDGDTIDIDPGWPQNPAAVIVTMIQNKRRMADAENAYNAFNYRRRVENWLKQKSTKRPMQPPFDPALKVSYEYTGGETADDAFTRSDGPERVAAPFTWPAVVVPPPVAMGLGVKILPGMWDDPTDSVEHGAQFSVLDETGQTIRVVGVRSPSPFTAHGYVTWLEAWVESTHGPWVGQ